MTFNTRRIRERLCLTCQKKVIGRADKKFCDDYCRNTFNNQLRSKTNNYIRQVNNALLKNRRILESLFTGNGERVEIHENRLYSMGFRFQYHTHFQVTEKGQKYLFCYEFGYSGPENGWYLLIRENEDPSGC